MTVSAIERTAGVVAGMQRGQHALAAALAQRHGLNAGPDDLRHVRSTIQSERQYSRVDFTQTKAEAGESKVQKIQLGEQRRRANRFDVGCRKA